MCALKIPTLVQNAHLHHLINILEQQTGMDCMIGGGGGGAECAHPFYA